VTRYAASNIASPNGSSRASPVEQHSRRDQAERLQAVQPHPRGRPVRGGRAGGEPDGQDEQPRDQREPETDQAEPHPARPATPRCGRRRVTGRLGGRGRRSDTDDHPFGLHIEHDRPGTIAARHSSP
jgi:hypothetical protein